MRFFALFIFILFVRLSAAQDTAPAFRFEHRAPGDTASRAPVVILLHGLGGNEKEIFALASRIPAGYHVFSLRGPVALSKGGFAWFNIRFPLEKHISYDYLEIRNRRKEILRFISFVGKNYRADTTRIILAGYSQGGIMAIDAAAKWSRKIWGAVSIHGGMLPETRETNRAAKMSGLHVFIGHGILDNVRDIRLSVRGREFLTSRGAKVTLKRYQAGHEISVEQLNDVESWLTELLLVKQR